MWTDFNLTDTQPQSMMKARFGMNDYRNISYNDNEFTPDDALAEHIATITYFKNELEVPFDGKKVVISHHGPQASSLLQVAMLEMITMLLMFPIWIILWHILERLSGLMVMYIIRLITCLVKPE